MKYILKIIAFINILCIVLMFLFLFINGIKFFEFYSVSDFFFGMRWISLSGVYGIVPLITGTFWVSIVAIVFSVIMSFFIVIYMAEYASDKMRKIYKINIEIMSAIPSVVLGFLGLYIFSDIIQSIFKLDTGLTALTGGIMLSFMAIPTIVSISDDALNNIDKSYKEASLALGANKLETILFILLPAAAPGIFSSIMLGFGRILGETITVLMITGNAPVIAKTPLVPVRTLTATIASEMGEVIQGSEHYYALFAIGLILFIISFIINILADYFIKGGGK